MNGITHMAMGFIMGELVWRHLKKKRQSGNYYRGYCWLLGALGGYSPDFDGVSGILANLFYFHEEFSIQVMTMYHRDYSHGLGFLFSVIISLIVLAVGTKKFGRDEKTSAHPWGQVPPEKHHLSPSILGIFIVIFFFYSEYWKFACFFILLFLQIILAWAYNIEKQPWYGYAFFLGAILHQFADFVNCRWMPYGPWVPELEWGLYINCVDFKGTLRYNILKMVLEVPFVFLAFYMAWKGISEKREFEKRKDNDVKPPNKYFFLLSSLIFVVLVYLLS